MNKKSGLADSPFFTKPQPAKSEVTSSMETNRSKRDNSEDKKSDNTATQPKQNLQPDKLTNLQTNKLTSLQTYILTILDDKASDVGSFRMSVTLLDKIDDILYLLKKRHKIKIAKKDLIAIALAFAFWDFETNGKESGIVKAKQNK